MQVVASVFDLVILNWPEVLIRTVLAILFGYLIGYERRSKSKPIDFRVYMIVAVSSCLIAMMSQELYGEYAAAESVISIDLAKIIEGVLAGIGFLGAGAIMKQSDDKLIGTATGASIWASGGIGLCLGFGFYGLAFVGFVSVAAILIVFGFQMNKETK